MKYIIFENNLKKLIASTDAKKDTILKLNPLSVAKEVSDSDFKKIALGRSEASLVNNEVVINEFSNDDISSVRPAITDATEASARLQECIDTLITSIKDNCGDGYDSNTDATSLVSFLEGIDSSEKTSWDAGVLYIEYIYDLPGCPQIFLEDIIF
tara:strand:+ start:1166 stop:1630 length:465 start_codon:yes stop_codon:yes gene_type:complete